MAQGTVSPSTAIQAFAKLVAPEIPDEHIDLLRAALAIAQSQYPNLETKKYVARVHVLAERAKTYVGNAPEPIEIIRAISKVMFEEEAFRGNREEYFDPRNSFLNDVLDRRLGIPITLAVIYMEIGKRLGLPLLGVGMPGHFLLKHYDEYANELLIDVFEGGRIVTPATCQQRLNEIYKGRLSLEPEHLSAVTRRQLLTRMINNLRNIYMSVRNFRKALIAADLILCMHPRSPEDIKQRAILRYNLNQISAALQDFELYVRIAPEASDAEEIRQTALSIRRNMALLN